MMAASMLWIGRVLFHDTGFAVSPPALPPVSQLCSVTRASACNEIGVEKLPTLLTG